MNAWCRDSRRHKTMSWMKMPMKALLADDDDGADASHGCDSKSVAWLVLCNIVMHVCNQLRFIHSRLFGGKH